MDRRIASDCYAILHAPGAHATILVAKVDMIVGNPLRVRRALEFLCGGRVWTLNWNL